MSEDVGDSFVSVGEANEGSRKKLLTQEREKLSRKNDKGNQEDTTLSHTIVVGLTVKSLLPMIVRFKKTVIVSSK